MHKKSVTYRLVVFILAISLGVIVALPTLIPSMDGKKITLGLDLQGGLHMLLGVQTDEAIVSKIKSVASGIKFFTDENNILIDNLRIRDDKVTLTLIDSDETQKLETMIDEFGGLVMSKDALDYSITLSEEEKAHTIEFAITQAVETMRNRLDQFGLAEPTVARQGFDNILVELPGIKTQEEEQRARELIAKAAHLQLMAVDERRRDRAHTMSDEEAASYGNLILEDSKSIAIKHIVHAIPILDGAMLTDARVAFDQNNQPIINFSLNGEGAKIFGDFTTKNVGNRLAVVLDSKVYSAPVIRERIGGGSGQISGNFTIQEAQDIAIALRSGALLAPVTLLEKRSIGPSLGADSVKSSLIALISGFVIVFIFMMIYYGIAGVIANIALIGNIFIIIAVMALFGATLTLPGMAGIVLTVGMAVDANVIINERIRELLREGASIRKSIEQGYENALSAIMDANITTLIAAVVLYAYGTGPIKGFAVTIGIGILASMLTAILGTHGIYDFLANRIERSKNLSLWFGIKRG